MTEIKEQSFTLTIYKAEYNQAFVKFLMKKYASAEGNKIVTLYDLTEAECNKIMSLMYKEADACAEVFTDFKTMDTEMKELTMDMHKLGNELRTRLLEFIGCPAIQGDEDMTLSQSVLYYKYVDAVQAFIKATRN